MMLAVLSMGWVPRLLGWILLFACGCGRVVPIQEAKDGGMEDEDGQRDGEMVCPPGLRECDGRCTDIQQDKLNCGDCGEICQDAPHASGVCKGGICEIDCNDGWWDLNRVMTDGCEYSCLFRGNNDLCNGEDDNCDGIVDNFDVTSCPRNSVMSCVTSCGSEGRSICSEDCIAGPCEPPPEECNGRDDDCDGEIDNGFECAAGRPAPCITSCGTVGNGPCNLDCTPAEPVGCHPPEEVCNWRDDDCDGQIDEGGLFDVVVAPVAVSHSSLGATNPVISFGLGRFLIAWEDGRDTGNELYTNSVSIDGTPLASDTRLIGTAATEFLGGVAWSGSNFAVVYSSDNATTTIDLWIATAGEDASRIGSNRVIMEAGEQFNPSVTWDGTSWVVVWSDDREVTSSCDVMFAKVEPVTLTLVPGSERRVSGTRMPCHPHPSVAWSGSHYAVVWTEPFPGLNDVYISILNEDGTTQVDDTGVTLGALSSFHPAVLWTGDRWIVSWSGALDVDTQGYFMTIVNERGMRMVPYVQVRSIPRWLDRWRPPFTIAHAPLGIGAVWQEEVGPGRYDIYFQRFSFDLTPIDATPLRVTSLANNWFPKLVWYGPPRLGFGIAWNFFDAEVIPHNQVRFAAVGCL